MNEILQAKEQAVVHAAIVYFQFAASPDSTIPQRVQALRMLEDRVKELLTLTNIPTTPGGEAGEGTQLS